MPPPPVAEQEWDILLATLAPWDLRTLMRHELEWHDAWTQGLLSRHDLVCLIRADQGLKEDE